MILFFVELNKYKLTLSIVIKDSLVSNSINYKYIATLTIYLEYVHISFLILFLIITTN